MFEKSDSAGGEKAIPVEEESEVGAFQALRQDRPIFKEYQGPTRLSMRPGKHGYTKQEQRDWSTGPGWKTRPTLTNDIARELYIRALPLFGHERACSMANVRSASVRRYCAAHADFAKRRLELLNQYRFAAAEAVRNCCLRIVGDAGSNQAMLEMAFRWLAANGDPMQLSDPAVAERQALVVAQAALKNGGSAMTRALPHLLTRMIEARAPGSEGVNRDAPGGPAEPGAEGAEGADGESGEAAAQHAPGMTDAEDPAMREVLRMVAEGYREEASRQAGANGKTR